MASSFLCAFLLLAFVCSSQADLVDDVCSKSLNPSACNQILRSDPRSKGADLAGLGQIAIDKSEAATNAAITVAKSFDNGKTKAAADTCIENFGDAIDNLNQASKLLKAKTPADKDTLLTRASAALTDITTCDDEFGDAEPSQLAAASSKTQGLINIVLVIANKIKSGN